MECLDGLRKRRALDARLPDRLDREQDAQLRVDVQVRHRGRRKLPCARDPRLLLRAVALVEGQEGEPEGDDGRGCEDRDERTKPMQRAPLEPGLPGTTRLIVGADGFPIGDARPEELAFALGLRQARLGGPGLEPGELRSAKEEARVTAASSHSAARVDSRWRARMSSRAASIQSRRSSHSTISASCAISTVGAPVRGSPSNDNSREAPNRSMHSAAPSPSTSTSARAAGRRVATPCSPTATSWRKSCFAATRPRLRQARVHLGWPRASSAPATPPMAPYAERVKVVPSRRSNSSVRAYWRSGSAPGWSRTSTTISTSRPGSSETPTPAAGAAIARSISSGASGETETTRSCSSRAKARWRNGRS